MADHWTHPYSGLPDNIVDFLRSAVVSDFVTLSAAGDPIDTPAYCIYNPAGTIDVTTGLAYPVKAERARRNPKVGLLIEGGPNEPVVRIAGMAAVRDADIQANVDRYIREVVGYFDSFACGNGWDVARQAVHYWARIIVEVKPRTIWWWPSPAALGDAPQRWDAAPGTFFPASDPAPAGAPTKAPQWAQAPWETHADAALAKGLPAHLSLVDADGFPFPVRAASVERSDRGFRLSFASAPTEGVGGRVSLTFMGTATFIGRLTPCAHGLEMIVERALPVLPFVQDMAEIWHPRPDVHAKISERFNGELARRGQSVPIIPDAMPAPSEGSLLRARRVEAMAAAMAGAAPAALG